MSLEMNIDFPGGKRVNATVGDIVVETDQSKQAGGDGSAPEPYMHFLASIGTCAGIYVLGFCRQRGISTEGIKIVQRLHANPVNQMVAGVDLDIVVPEDFPERYHDALIRVADQCAVKKHLENPPTFNVQTRVEALV